MIFNINGFEILDKIGQGGMASVWKARQISLDRIVAIKILSEGFSDEPEDVRRFQEEAQSAAKLKHPGIVLVHDANAENGLYYFIMEYVSGYTVGDWVRRKGALSEKDALLVADCVADALDYAWDKEKIVHCDIKPDNIIIDEDGTVKVADLGLARTIGLMELDAEEIDEIMGTPAYISPEQAMGEADLDFRADIYSLGAMLYHLVTGKMMFEEFDDDETLDKQVNDRVDDPIDINPSLSKGICWLIERMTAKEPDLREKSWDAVRSDINRVRRGLLPKGEVLPDDASTVRRSVRRTVGDYKRVATIQNVAHSARTPVIVTTIKVAVIAVALAIALKMYMQQSRVYLAPTDTVASEDVSDAGLDAEIDSEVIADPVDDSAGGYLPAEVMDVENIRAKEMYEFANTWHEENNDDLATSIEQFKSVVEDTRGSQYSLMAQQKIRELQSLMDDAIQAVLDGLDAEAGRRVVDHKYDSAIMLMRGYDGSYAAETSEVRNKKAELLEKQKRTWRNSQRQMLDQDNSARNRSIESLVMAVLSDDLNLAIELIDDMIENRIFDSVINDLKSVLVVLKKASTVNSVIIDSFGMQYGETIDVYLVKGMRTLTIGTVSGNSVECRQMLSVGRGGVSTMKIGVDDLSDYERLQRMGDDSQYEVSLVKGIMAFQSNAYSHAEKYFGMTHPLLKKYLLMKLRGEMGETEVVGRSAESSIRKRHPVPNGNRRKRPKQNRFDVFDDEKDDLF